MKGRILLSVFILVCVVQSGMAQEELGRIALNLSNQKKVRAFILHDSIIVSFQSMKSGVARPKFTLFQPDGTAKPLEAWPMFRTIDLLTIHSSPDSLFFYYIEDTRKANLLRAVLYDKKTDKIQVAARSIPIPGNLACVYEDGDLYFVNLDRARTSLHLTQIRNLNIVREWDKPLSSTFFLGGETVAAIMHGHEPQPWQARTSLKLYVDKNKLTLCKDLPKIGAGSGTAICEIDLTSDSVKPRQYFIADKSGESFTSYLNNGTLYRVAKNKPMASAFYISVFDSTSRKAGDFAMEEKATSYRGEVAYTRATDSKRVLNNRNVWDALSNTGDIFVSVHPYDTSRVVLKVGTHTHTDLRSGAAPMFAAFGPVGMLASAMASAVIMSLDQTVESRDLYFYLIGNTGTGFSYWDGEGVFGRYIDGYEMFDPKLPVDYKVKAYAETGDFVIAVYQEKKKHFPCGLLNSESGRMRRQWVLARQL